MTDGKKKPRIAAFASGSGGNFEALAKACASGEIDAEMALCVCDRPGARVVERAGRLGVPVLECSPKSFGSKAGYESEILAMLRRLDIDLICLAGYMRIVGPTLLDVYGGRIVNIHPALLPAFKGAHAIRDAFEFGVKVYGVTVHYIDETVDGGRIIAQAPVCYEGDDIEALEEMIHAVEHPLYVKAVNIALGELAAGGKQ